MKEDEMVGWHHRLNGHEFEQTSGVMVHGAYLLLGMGIFPDRGSNPCLLHWASRLFTIEPPGKPSIVPLSSCPQSFPASGSFQMSQLFASGAQSIGISASASVLPMNIQD